MIAFRPVLDRENPPPRLGPSRTERLAAAMLEIAFSGQTCDRERLILKGFTGAEIDAHAEAARDLATARCVRLVS